MGKELSVKDIAEMAGVSIATVSRVINQNGRFSKETEERVKKIIEEYDFHPNQLARGLRVSKVRVIGILVPDITNEFFAMIILELQKILMTYGYLTLICNNNEDERIENEQMDMLLGQKVSGIIYVGGRGIAKIRKGLPFVCIDRRPVSAGAESEVPYCLIESDNVKGGRLAAEELYGRQCRNVCVVSYNQEISAYKDRVEGFMQAMRSHGIEPMLCIAEYMNHYNEGENMMEELLEENPGLDGVFFTTDYLALGGLRSLARRKIPVPGKVKVIGYDDISLCENVFPALTTIRQNVKQMAEQAADLLISLVNHETVSRDAISKIDVELISRETT